MSAQEIIEQIKALPREERALVDQFIKSGGDGKPEDFERLVDRVLDKHADLMQRLAQ